MKVTALWYGGTNYASPSVEDDLERFDSMRDAADAFWRRGVGMFDSYRPCVESPEMHLFFGEPDTRDPYPDRIITVGPRGGIRVERA